MKPAGTSAGMQKNASPGTGVPAPFSTAEAGDVPRLERLCRKITSLSSKGGNDDAGEVARDVARDVFRELDDMPNISLQEFRRRYRCIVVLRCDVVASLC